MNWKELIRDLRGRRHQADLAADLDVSQTTVSLWERQGVVPRGNALIRLINRYPERRDDILAAISEAQAETTRA